MAAEKILDGIVLLYAKITENKKPIAGQFFIFYFNNQFGLKYYCFFSFYSSSQIFKGIPDCFIIPFSVLGLKVLLPRKGTRTILG